MQAMDITQPNYFAVFRQLITDMEAAIATLKPHASATVVEQLVKIKQCLAERFPQESARFFPQPTAPALKR